MSTEFADTPHGVAGGARRPDPGAWPLWTRLAVGAGVLVSQAVLWLALYKAIHTPRVHQWVQPVARQVAAWVGELSGTAVYLSQVVFSGVLAVWMYVVLRRRRREQEQYFRLFFVAWLVHLAYYVVRLFTPAAVDAHVVFNLLSAVTDCLFLLVAASLVHARLRGRELDRAATLWIVVPAAGYYSLLLLLEPLTGVNATIAVAAASFSVLWFELYAILPRLRRALPLGVYPVAAVFAVYALTQCLYPFVEGTEHALGTLMLGAMLLKSVYGSAFIVVAMTAQEERLDREIREAHARRAEADRARDTAEVKQRASDLARQKAEEEKENAEKEKEKYLDGQKRAAKEREELRRTLNVTNTAHYRVSGHPTGVIETSNEAEARILGYAGAEQLLGRSRTELYFSPEDEREHVRALEAAGGTLENAILRVRHREGHPIFIDVTCNLLYDDHGAPVGREGIYRDATARVAERARDRYADALNKAIVDARPADRAGPDEVLVHAVRAAREALEARGAVILVTCRRDDRRAGPGWVSVRAADGIDLEQLSPWTFPERELHASEAVVWSGPGTGPCAVLDAMLDRAGAGVAVVVPFARTDKQRVGYLCAWWEVDDGLVHSRAEALEPFLYRLVGALEHQVSMQRSRTLDLFPLALEKREPRDYLAEAVRRLHELVPARRWWARVYDDGRVVCQATNQSTWPARLPARPIKAAQSGAIWPPDDSRASIRDSLDRPRTAFASVPVPGKDGRSMGYIHFEDRLLAGAPTESMAFGLHALEVLEFGASVVGHAVEMLLAEQGRNFWLSRLVHEFQAPIQGIAANADLLDRRGSQLHADLRQRLFGNIQLACRTATRIVRGLRVVRDGVQDLNPVLTELYGDILRKTLAELRPFCRQEGLRYREHIGDYSVLPPLFVDQEKMSQLFTNLVVNGIKYVDRKMAREFKLGLDFGATRTHYVVKVMNWGGIGIDAEDRERVFAEGYRTRAAKATDARGMGLGLTIAREIARAHGGDLKLTELSAPTVFEVHLPKSLQRAPFRP